MRLYQSRFYELGPEQCPLPPYRARGWIADLRSLEVVKDGYDTPPTEAEENLNLKSIIHTEKLDDGRLKTIFAPEIIIQAPDRLVAQRAVNLITAAKVLMDGDFTSGDPTIATPDDLDDPEDLLGYDFDLELGFSSGTFGYATATRLAAKATQKKRWTHALIKHWLSLRTCNVPSIEHHPRYGDNFMVKKDPFDHAVMSQAITTGFSAIEELELNVKASEKRPSKIKGKWNPLVLNDLKKRLIMAKVNPEKRIPWIARIPPTRIEKKYSLPDGEPAPWAGYSNRDRMIKITDAIHRSELMRSRVSSHRMHSLTSSLTIYDVVNVQSVARRLLLDTLGFHKLARSK